MVLSIPVIRSETPISPTGFLAPRRSYILSNIWDRLSV